MNICVVGAGYVGLVTAACLTKMGHIVVCVDKDEGKISALSNGEIPIYEPGLDDIIKANKKLTFSTDIADGVRKSDLIFICVSTPNRGDGEPDLSDVKEVAKKIGQAIDSYKTIVNKSTVPIGTAKLVEKIIEENNASSCSFDVVSNPEFLREGSAIDNFLRPDRIVIGTSSEKALQVMTKLYKSIDAPVIVTNQESSELIKYASNAFLATKLSFINAISQICDKAGANVDDAAKGMGLDKRIGSEFLKPGPGWGGSCFLKDTLALVKIAEKYGYDFALVKETVRINEKQQKLIVSKVEKNLKDLKGKRVGILGLSFKPGTDDIRESPAVNIIKQLQAGGAKVSAYDPVAQKKAEKVLDGSIDYATSPYKAAAQADALLVLTEWDEFTNLDFGKIKNSLKNPVIVDARNCLNKEHLERLGFIYEGVGK